ncbi:MAG: hypothetical protein ACOC0P_07575 [Planctomycetota bacterium]
MKQDQLRQALRELNGERDCRFVFEGTIEQLIVRNALLIPEEPDGLVKVSDGKKVFLLDAERIMWIEIG